LAKHSDRLILRTNCSVAHHFQLKVLREHSPARYSPEDSQIPNTTNKVEGQGMTAADMMPRQSVTNTV
jgi:hypothetical protein